ncbi:PSD1 and planctomycete cytochrome C domain-containing protein [Isosphaeraceae bacterium EP7]
MAPMLAAALICLAQSVWADVPAPKVQYNRDIRPILSENCFACHGPDKGHRKADLRLDLRDVAIEMGAITPGDVDASELVARILAAADDEALMPPTESNKVLTSAQKDLLKRWVAEGAEYQPHWAYVPPKRPMPPAVDATRGQVVNPIDAFILAGHPLKASPEADKRTLLRRLSLDLTGLPPSPAEVNAFLADESADAYERQVDRLLRSPHYGERMAVPWLDLARFADTVGYHGDQNQNVFPYRDYVINAFNTNKPFDQFTTEQLAGDLLPDPTPEQLTATSFNRLNMMTREGGAQAKEYLAKYAADRVRTVSSTWMGSTLGCAECHDHKYDPFTARDFYSLGAFFADVRQWGVYSDYGYTPVPELKGFNNDFPFPPEIEVDSPYLKRRQQGIEREIARVAAEATAPIDADRATRDAFEAWLAQARNTLKVWPDGWISPSSTILQPKPGDASTAAELEDGSILVAGKPAGGGGLKVELRPTPGRVSALRVELLPDPANLGYLARDKAESISVRLEVGLLKSGQPQPTPLPIWFADAEIKAPRYNGGSPIQGVTDVWTSPNTVNAQARSAVYVLRTPIRLAEGDALVVFAASSNLGRVRVSVSPFGTDLPLTPVVDAPLVEALNAERDKRTAEQTARLRKLSLLSHADDPDALARIQALRNEANDCRDGRAYITVTKAWEPSTTRVLPRGNWQDETGPVVTPAVPGFLAIGTKSEGRQTRLDLARWLTSPENPLTARVFVNRLWKQFFGNGLSTVVEDLGSQGEAPTHPELLDWLAADFVEGGWDVKATVKRIVMSGTYRQDSRPRPELREADPNNRLLTSQNPRRLEAEFVRDNALSIAGLLNLELGGPSAHPYQPAGYYANIQFPDRDYKAERDDRQYRRGLYSHWQRTFLHPMLANFDAPSREECNAARNVANTPQQALTLLNDPTFVEAARALASRTLATPGDDDARIDGLLRLALARPAKPAELRSLIGFLGEQRRIYASDPDAAGKLVAAGPTLFRLQPGPDASETAAWMSVCRVVLNLHETITRY